MQFTRLNISSLIGLASILFSNPICAETWILKEKWDSGPNAPDSCRQIVESEIPFQVLDSFPGPIHGKGLRYYSGGCNTAGLVEQLELTGNINESGQLSLLITWTNNYSGINIDIGPLDMPLKNGAEVIAGTRAHDTSWMEWTLHGREEEAREEKAREEEAREEEAREEEARGEEAREEEAREEESRNKGTE